MEKDKKKSQPKQPEPRSIDVEVGSVKSLRANYLNQLDVGEDTFEGGEEASATEEDCGYDKGQANMFWLA